MTGDRANAQMHTQPFEGLVVLIVLDREVAATDFSG
jgi:hypothetical protein